MNKICTKCRIEKNTKEFSKNKNYSDGFNIYCKPCRVKYQRICFLKNPDTQRKYKRKWLKMLKEKVYNHYSGGNIKCAKCGFTDIRALSVDHINGNGSKHRQKIGHGDTYRWLVNNNFPIGFQILCMNCQFIKKSENKECTPIKIGRDTLGGIKVKD